MTADGWRCPECGLILGPHVNEHRCDPPSAGTAGVPAVAPGGGGGGGGFHGAGGGSVTVMTSASGGEYLRTWMRNAMQAEIRQARITGRRAA